MILAAVETNPPSVIGIIQLVLIIIILPLLGYALKAIGSLVSAVAVLAEQMRNTTQDIAEMKTDIKDVRKRGARIPTGDRDN